jgi:hypothetical protein
MQFEGLARLFYIQELVTCCSHLSAMATEYLLHILNNFLFHLDDLLHDVLL